MMFTPVAALALAGGNAVAARTPTITRLFKALRPPTEAAAPVMRTVWRGVDLDGDGAPDFVNPTGQAPRDHDSFGFGAFGASRDGGARRHEGVDYAAAANQAVAAPMSGFVTKIGYAYSGDSSLKFVEISNPALGYVVRTFYVEPTVAVGQALRLGQTIGEAASLQAHYPGITDHVHLEILNAGGRRIDGERMIVARRIPLKDRSATG
ncbi:MAG: peptidoglycan DD-metalloendopeptidase family protein [Caulobacter sp.]|nr:peptidoglycan DD-metalloendopeptidase family protein [Caulobacter sp.]